ncbi:MAG: M50 family metallopeptidase [Clostridia bacterium]|nr:M50 family metallopeptidase [Clostridia bacterium]
MSETKKKKRSLSGIVWNILIVAIGAGCGFLVAAFADLSFLDGLSTRMRFLSYILIICLIGVAYFLQVILHELGHMVLGLVSGYRFSSFRIGRTMLIKKDGKMQWKRFSLAGTGGQCLMIPPDWEGKRPKTVMFLLGGCLFNLVFGALFLCLAYIFYDVFWAMLFFGACGVIGVLSFLLNGIPLRTDLIVNDGYNALAMRRDPETARELCIHLVMNAKSVEGVRLCEMPAEWFAEPTEAQMKNAVFAERAVFACNRLMDERRFEDAAVRIRSLLDSDAAVVGVHRKLLLCDLLFCELVGARRAEVLGELYTREQYNFMRLMKEYPAVIRTEYAYAVLYQHDGSKARMLLDAFEKCAKTYPNEGDILTEREIIKQVKAVKEREAENEE